MQEVGKTERAGLRREAGWVVQRQDTKCNPLFSTLRSTQVSAVVKDSVANTGGRATRQAPSGGWPCLRFRQALNTVVESHTLCVLCRAASSLVCFQLASTGLIRMSSY